MSDERLNELIAELKNGSKPAYRELYDRYAGIIYNRVFGKTGDQDYSKQAVVWAFGEIKSIERETGEQSFLDWLNGYADRLAGKYAKSAPAKNVKKARHRKKRSVFSVILIILLLLIVIWAAAVILMHYKLIPEFNIGYDWMKEKIVILFGK